MNLPLIGNVFCAAAALGATLVASALIRRGRRDRATIAGLQRALITDCPVVPGLTIGAAVLSASPAAGVGGDLVDVFELDGRFSLLVVADVCGRGIAAAAHTAFIKYTLRALALESDGDPAVVLAKFNAMYPRTVKDVEAFVVLIIGIIDNRNGEVRYASAGHEPALIRRRNGSVALLPPTGPIIGAAPLSSYRSDVVRLERGDVMVWTSDGLTESRDSARQLLGIDGLAGWVAEAPQAVDRVAESLVVSLRRRSGHIDDDVAILAVGFDGAEPRVGQRLPLAAEKATAAATARGR